MSKRLSLLIVASLLLCALCAYKCLYHNKEEHDEYIYVSSLGSVSVLPSRYVVDVKGSVGGVALTSDDSSVFFDVLHNEEGRQLYNYVNSLDVVTHFECGYKVQAANDKNVEVVMISNDKDYAFFANVAPEDVSLFITVLCETKMRRKLGGGGS